MASDTITREAFRQRFAKSTGFTFFSTTTSGGSSTTLVDTGILKIDTDRLKDKWVLITSGTADTEARRISSVSTSTITVTAAYSATIATSVTYEILAYDPDWMHDAIDEALRGAPPDLYLPLRDETLKVGNQLVNWDFETFSGGFTGWTENGSATITKEATRVFQGSFAEKAVPSAANESTSQDLFTAVNIDEVAQQSINLWAWGWSDGATGMKVRVSFDGGSTFTDGNQTHSGFSQWEKLDLNVAIPETATTISPYLWHGTSGTTTVFWDNAHASIIDDYRLTVPSSILSLRTISQQYLEDEPDGRYFPLAPSNRPIDGRILRLEGQGALTVPTTDALTTELNDKQVEALKHRAAAILFDRMKHTDPGRRDEWEADSDDEEDKYQTALKQPGTKTKRQPASKRIVWDTEEDASGTYISFKAATR